MQAAASFTEIAGTTMLAINTGMLLHLVYSAGRRIEQLETHERRIRSLEATRLKAAIENAD